MKKLILENKTACALMLLGVAMAVFGIATGQHRQVLEKAIKICLECVGIG